MARKGDTILSVLYASRQKKDADTITGLHKKTTRDAAFAHEKKQKLKNRRNKPKSIPNDTRTIQS